jgi:hypothetical protein
MNSKQLFFFSLILLSVAMGMNWFKNRPKTRPVKSNRPRVALNLSDLQLQDGSEASDSAAIGEGEQSGDGENSGEGGDATTETGEAGEGEGEGEGSETTGDEKKPEIATDTTEIASAAVDLMDSDPIINALKNMPLNPFERSPYAQLV